VYALLNITVVPRVHWFSYISTVLFGLMLLSSLGITKETVARYLARSARVSSLRRDVIIDAVVALQTYRQKTTRSSDRRRHLFSKLSWTHKTLATSMGYVARLNDIEQLIQKNGQFLDSMVSFAKTRYSITDAEVRLARPPNNGRVIELIGHFLRDWSAETELDRQALLNPVLDCLEKEFKNITSARILVPGSGLARLAYEIAQRGFNTDAIEFSGLMDLGAQFVLSKQDNPSIIYPFIHESSFQRSGQSQCRPVKIQTHDCPKNLQILYGDFTKLRETNYDAIVTLFFIDTAENVLQYLDVVKQLLKPGGVWINYGPLKWGSHAQLEFSLEELEQVIDVLGWKIEKTFEGQNEYIADHECLWTGIYKLRGWVARK
jgi:carnosine N-methyltransferase